MPSRLKEVPNGLSDVGPPGDELARFPMRFVTTVSLGDASGTVDPMPTNNGTMTLLQLPNRRVGVTCYHVIEAYREQRLMSPSREFKAGDHALDPVDRLVSEDPILDLAVLDLDDVDPERLSAGSRELEFFEPAEWPLGTAEAGEPIALGGYPSFYRALSSDPDRDLGVFTLGTTCVIDVGIENIVCGLGWEYWIEGSGPRRMNAHADLGGLSGGPGFVWRGSEFHFVGVIFAVAQSRDYLRLRPARFIRRDATLWRV